MIPALRRSLTACTLALTIAGICAAQSSTTSSAPSEAKALTPLRDIAGARVETTAPPSPPIDAAPNVRRPYEAAKAKLADGRLKDAATLVEEAAKLATQPYYELKLLTAQIQAESQQLSAALRSANEALALRPTAVDPHFLIGGITLTIGDAAAALPHFRAATLAADTELGNPHVTLAWFFLGQCLAAEGMTLAAAQAYERFDLAIWEENPEHRNATKVAALLTRMPHGALEIRLELLRRLARPKDAVAICRSALERWPDDPALERHYARALLTAGQAAEALAFCRERLSAAESRSGLLSVAVEAAREAGKLDGWLADIEKLSASRPPAYVNDLIAALRAAGAHDAAIRIGRSLLTRPDAPPTLAWYIAVAELGAGKPDDAFHTLAEHIRNSSNLIELPDRAVNEWNAAMRDFAGAAAAIATLRANRERDFALSFVLALSAVAIGDSETADRGLKECIDARPDFAPALALQGRRLLLAYDWKAALENAAELAHGNPQLAAAQFIIGEASDGLDDYIAAEAAYRQAMRLAPGEVAYPLALGRHYLRRGDSPSLMLAQRAFSEAIAVDPRSGEAHERLIHSYVLKGMGELAREQYRRMEAADVPEIARRRAGTTIRHLDALFSPAHLAELKSNLDADPTDVDTAEQLFDGLVFSRQYDAAAEVLRAALAHAPESFALRFADGRMAMIRGDYEAAAKQFRVLADRYPNRIPVIDFLSRAYRFDFQIEKARPLMQRLLDWEKGGDRGAAFAMALLECHTNFGEWPAALAQLDELSRRFPRMSRLAEYKIKLLLLADRKDEAYALAVEQFKAAAPTPDSLSAFVDAGLAAGKHDELIRLLRESIGAAQDKALLTEKLVEVLVETKQADEALKIVKDFAPARAEHNIQRRMWFALCYRGQGKLDVAAEEYRELLKLAGQSEHVDKVQNGLIRVLIEAKKYDDALDLCGKWSDAAELGEIPMAVLMMRRGVLNAAGREQEQIELLQVMLERARRPDFLEIYPGAASLPISLANDLGYTWIDRGENVERATALIREAVAASPFNAAYLDSLGWAYYKSGDFAAAAKWLARATSLYGEDRDEWGARDPVQHDHYADALFRLGRRDDATRHWKLALEFVDAEAAAARRELPDDRKKLRVAVAEKLAAIERGESPTVAPTAAEHDSGKGG